MYLTKNQEKMILKEEKGLNMVPYSFEYWKEMLFAKCVRLFDWKGLPEGVPQKEIEVRLIADGFCGFVDDTAKGFMIASGSLSGPTQYWDEFTDFTYAAATATGGTKKINKNAVIINNNTLRNPLMPTIEKYASLLAHCDATLLCSLVNLRYTDLLSSDDEGTAESISEAHKRIYKGEDSVIIDNSLVESIQNLANSKSSGTGVMDAIDARNEILRAFYQEIGVNYTRDKKERMVVDEVDSNNQLLLLNVNDMLRQREIAAKRISELFDLDVTVDVAPEYKNIMMDKVEGDDSNDD